MSEIGLLAISLLVVTAWQQDISPYSTGWLNAAYATAIVAFVIPLVTFARCGKQAALLMP